MKIIYLVAGMFYASLTALAALVLIVFRRTGGMVIRQNTGGGE